MSLLQTHQAYKPYCAIVHYKWSKQKKKNKEENKTSPCTNKRMT